MLHKNHDEGKSGLAKSLTSQQQLTMQDLIKDAPSDEALRIIRLTSFFDRSNLGIKCKLRFSSNMYTKVIML